MAGKYAVVTGASSGIGRELARVLAEESYDLLINAEDAELAEAEHELSAGGANVEAVRADLSKPKGVKDLYTRIGAANGGCRASAISRALASPHLPKARSPASLSRCRASCLSSGPMRWRASPSPGFRYPPRASRPSRRGPF